MTSDSDRISLPNIAKVVIYATDMIVPDPNGA